MSASDENDSPTVTILRSPTAEIRERAVRLVFEQQDAHESQWATIVSIAEKMGCSAETLRKWVRHRRPK